MFFKPKHQVNGITILGNQDCASVWYQVSIDSIILKYFWLIVSFISSYLFRRNFNF